MFDLPDGRFVGVDKPIVCRALHMYRFVRAKDRAVLEPTLDLGIHCRTTDFLGHVLARVDGHVSSFAKLLTCETICRIQTTSRTRARRFLLRRQLPWDGR